MDHRNNLNITPEQLKQGIRISYAYMLTQHIRLRWVTVALLVASVVYTVATNQFLPVVNLSLLTIATVGITLWATHYTMGKYFAVNAILKERESEEEWRGFPSMAWMNYAMGVILFYWLIVGVYSYAFLTDTERVQLVTGAATVMEAQELMDRHGYDAQDQRRQQNYQRNYENLR